MGEARAETQTLRTVTSVLSRIHEASVTLGAKTDAPGEAARADTLIAPTERAPATPAPAAPAGAADARYESLGVLGEGGMGRVEHVRDRDLLREVAVKTLLPELLSDPRLLQQFLWEARVTAYLDHPNIVPVHDLGVTPEGSLYFTMKLVKGTTLEVDLARIKKSDATDDRASGLNRRLRLFLQLCNAISFAHARGVLHRDLKPANVMVGEFGEVLVTDWGIAMPLPDDSGAALREFLPGDLSVLGKSAGTPMYMSPEQARGEALDARSDLYTLGVILYELVALQPAFEGTSVSAILERVTAGDAVPLQSVCPRATTAIAAVVAKAMATDPAARYPTARALADEVETVLDGRTPKADNAPLVKQLARFYIARDPGMSRMRVVDIDLWMVACHFFGAGIGLFVALFVPISPWWWAFLIGGALIMVRPTVRWWRLRKNT